jgi:hypothetical protein
MHLRKAVSPGGCIGLHNFSKSILTAAFVGVTALAIPLAGHAQVLTISITDNLGHSLTVADGNTNDLVTLGNSVFVNPAALLTQFPNLNPGSLLLASFNTPAGTLATNGDLFGATASTITITTSINGLTVPSGFARTFNDTNTIAYNNSASGTAGTDTDGVDTGNALFGQNTIDTPFTFASTDPTVSSGAGGGPGFVFFNTGPFAVTSKTVIQVIPNGLSQFTTNSIVRASAVPEPGAFAMLASLGLTGSLFAVRRLRRSKE